MTARSRLWLTLLPAAAGLLALPVVQRATAGELPAACRGDHWVAAWTAAAQGSSLGRPDDGVLGLADGPARTFADQTLRMVVSPALGGSALRVRFGNHHGTAPVTIASATVARRAFGAAAVPSSIEGLRFGGADSIVVPAGAEAVSDPVFVDVAAGAALLVSFHVTGLAVLDHHQWAQSTQYAAGVAAGDHSYDTSAAAFDEELSGWYGVSGVDVLAPRGSGAVVALGDSITDGVGSSPNLDRRWPDRLNERLRSLGVPLGVVNAGIAGNQVALTSGIGPAAVDRVEVDALRLAGVTDLVVFEGINDVFMSGGASDAVGRVVAGYEAIISAAHDAGVRVIGATLTPASLDGAREAARLSVNEWIRSSGAFDAVVDFDAVARDPSQPSRLRPAWDAGMAHLTDRGYEALAKAFPVDELQGVDC